MSYSEQNIPHSRDLATKLSWPEISRQVATAFPFGENQELYNIVLNSLVPGSALLYHFSLSLSLSFVCVRACHCAVGLRVAACVGTDILSFIIYFEYTSA